MPGDGAKVTVGEDLVVNVLSVPEGSVFNVGLVGTGHLGGAVPLTAAPYHFVVNLANGLPYGLYRLIAVGEDQAGNVVLSPPVSISAEPGVPVVKLIVQPEKLRFHFVGEQLPLIVSGVFDDGTIADLTRSVATVFSSSEAKSATVSPDGLVTAVGVSDDGTSIVVRRGALSVTVPISVPAAARGDLTGDGVVDLKDLEILRMTINTPATKPIDARDLNGDGVIDEQDVEMLIGLCNLPGCAIPSAKDVKTHEALKNTIPQPAEKNLRIIKLPVHDGPSGVQRQQ
jgi:hypothetical protein